MKYFDKDGGAQLKSAFDEVVLEWPHVAAATMFGCPSYRAEGTLFAFLVTEGLVLTQLSSDHRERMTEEFETGPFKAGDRTVTKWVDIPVDDLSELQPLLSHVKASYISALEDSDR